MIIFLVDTKENFSYFYTTTKQALVNPNTIRQERKEVMKIMTAMRLVKNLTLLLILGVIVAACAHAPGGIAASTTPIEGREYTTLGRAVETDSIIYILGLIPASGVNHTSDAINEAIRKHGGDAMINVTVESYSQWWILFTRIVTRVEGNVIRFER